MWVEINAVSVPPEQRQKIFDISPKPPQDFMMRVCVFDTEGIKMMDAEGTSDVFIKAFFDPKKDALETDTHYRCQTGEASFNYRLNYKVTYPRPHYRFTVQAYDRDFFKSNDIIGSATIDLTQVLKDAELTQRPLQVDKKYYMKYMKKEGEKALEMGEDDIHGSFFWLDMMSKEIDKKTKAERMVSNGKVRVRIDITTYDYYEKTKIGSGRDEPNNSPNLLPPTGRLHFSLNPLEMYRQLIGKAMRDKIARWLCIGLATVCCIAILYYLVPIIFGGLITNWITNGF